MAAIDTGGVSATARHRTWGLVVLGVWFFAALALGQTPHGLHFLMGAGRALWFVLPLWIIGAVVAYNRPPATASVPIIEVPRSVLLRSGERALFAQPCRCALPVPQTDGRVATAAAVDGFLIVTNQRVVASALSDVRDWPLAQILSVAPQNRHRDLALRISNVGAAVCSWRTPIAGYAESAIRMARNGEG